MTENTELRSTAPASREQEHLFISFLKNTVARSCTPTKSIKGKKKTSFVAEQASRVAVLITLAYWTLLTTGQRSGDSKGKAYQNTTWPLRESTGLLRKDAEILHDLRRGKRGEEFHEPFATKAMKMSKVVVPQKKIRPHAVWFHWISALEFAQRKTEEMPPSILCKKVARITKNYISFKFRCRASGSRNKTCKWKNSTHEPVGRQNDDDQELAIDATNSFPSLDLRTVQQRTSDLASIFPFLLHYRESLPRSL